MVDFEGNILDINYRKLSYGGPNNTSPKEDTDIAYDRARRISRRGTGYHFQLSTNTKKSDEPTSSSNLIFDIDKEGLVKVNIPASTNTGNIPFPSNVSFGDDKSDISITYTNPSSQEPVPVTLRDENGEIVFPKSSAGVSHRYTGVRYDNSDATPYFPSGDEETLSNSLRINPTKYHNMYAAAERLIANTIRSVNIPHTFVALNGLPEELAVGKPFEVPIPNELTVGEEEETYNPAAYPTNRSVVAVEPGKSAINSGGDTIVAGLYYSEDDAPHSNSFQSTTGDGKEVSASISNDYGEERNPIGGKSLHMNMEGSIEASVGRDNVDQKSLILDTAGSIITWLGKDINNRSLVAQTDGDVLLNIGGSYSGTDQDDRSMNIGRFELRVNVTDKKFIATQFDSDTDGLEQNPGAESDIIISLSENGIVIAGMKADLPMVLRNDGQILIESTSSNIILKGNGIEMVEAKGKPKTLRATRR